MNLKLINRDITVEEYQCMRKTTGWAMLNENVVKKALKNDLYSVLVFDDEKLVGMGRVVGDGAMYFYVQDIIVIPEYKRMGIGRMIMQSIEVYLENTTNHNSFVGLMAAEGVHEFYYQFGYKKRPERKPGMFKMIDKKKPVD